MKIRLTVDGRRYSGSATEIVAKLASGPFLEPGVRGDMRGYMERFATYIPDEKGRALRIMLDASETNDERCGNFIAFIAALGMAEFLVPVAISDRVTVDGRGIVLVAEPQGIDFSNLLGRLIHVTGQPEGRVWRVTGIEQHSIEAGAKGRLPVGLLARPIHEDDGA